MNKDRSKMGFTINDISAASNWLDIKRIDGEDACL